MAIAVLCWGLAKDLSETPTQMGVVMKTAFLCDFRNRELCAD